ncbi:hypothetical protein CFP59_05302 [Streptomyces malaysiensis subsp. malaysiensis]|uniref:hypothetical protein n=1 Tax=Streptomyces malaysiensis TaxID=92644 RepID=UPI000CA15829|nr:hypothetical protein [Streptomyces sp. M56]AUA13147.1 hypothetical protein CFP59_05302 [Streptomyces sp. M56]
MPSSAAPSRRAADASPHVTSEATRLLCAGTYLDDDFRDAVVDELYVHEERAVAPSLGIDAARVLAHALRARRLEAGWTALLVSLWVLDFLLAQGFFYLFLLSCALLLLAAWARGGAMGPFRADYPGADGVTVTRRRAAAVLRLLGCLSLLSYVASALTQALTDEPDPSGLQGLAPALTTGSDTTAAWFALVIPAAMATAVALHREHVARVLATDLEPETFADISADPAEGYEGGRFQRVRALIRREQHSPVILYHDRHPFLGAGTAHDTWTLAVELRPREGGDPVPLDNRVVLERIRPLVEKLRTPSIQGTGRTGHTAGTATESRDRLRGLELDECVFLKVTGLRSRSFVPYGEADFARERAEAVEEGGEIRRHFLRIRVGAWREEVVTTVFVRVHTQGGMLMLEFAPHVLRPIRPDFRAVDRLSDSHRRGGLPGKVVWAVGRTPTAAGRAVIHAFRSAAFVWRMYAGGYEAAIPDGPWISVRELGSDTGASLFQEMDVSRYLKSVEDRVANGVRRALDEAGWETGEFEQKVINVSGGGVFIESAENSAFGFGDHNTISNTTGSTGSTGSTGNTGSTGSTRGAGSTGGNGGGGGHGDG